MATEIKAPEFPESVSEGTLMNWYKQPGDKVRTDEKLADIETDKIVLEVAAHASGVLEKVVKNMGDTIISGEIIAILKPGPVTATPAPTKMDGPLSPPATTPMKNPGTGSGPAARKLMAEHRFNPADVPASGREGRITKSDVLNHVQSQVPKPTANQSSALVAPKPAESVSGSAAPPTIPADTMGRKEERVPMSRIRARIAERLVNAQQTAAILTTFNEVTMKPVMDLRTKYKQEFQEEHGVKLGFMSFFVKATVEALKRFPVVNASVDGTDIIYHGFYDIGIAVSSPRGLVVPILRSADHLSFAETETAIRDLGARAHENKLGLDDLQGGTFSISNGGIFGSLLSTPILNPPQSAILGMHAIQDRAVVENGSVVVRPVMFLALSYDHRIVDGREAVLFLVTIKQMLEEPSRLLLDL